MEARRQAAGEPYSRPGDPRKLFLTAEQWASYDEWQALWDRMDRKYGHFRATAAMNLARRIW